MFKQHKQVLFQIMGVSLVQYRAQIGGFAGGRSCLAPFASFGSGDKVDKR